MEASADFCELSNAFSGSINVKEFYHLLEDPSVVYTSLCLEKLWNSVLEYFVLRPKFESKTSSKYTVGMFSLKSWCLVSSRHEWECHKPMFIIFHVIIWGSEIAQYSSGLQAGQLRINPCQCWEIFLASTPSLLSDVFLMLFPKKRRRGKVGTMWSSPPFSAKVKNDAATPPLPHKSSWSNA
jgi:hypothetical protein